MPGTSRTRLPCTVSLDRGSAGLALSALLSEGPAGKAECFGAEIRERPGFLQGVLCRTKPKVSESQKETR